MRTRRARAIIASPKLPGARLGGGFRAALALFMVVTLASPGVAQTITGRVVADDGSAPLSGAVVSLLGDEGQAIRRVLTNREGFFTLAATLVGTYRLRAEMIGYQTVDSQPFQL